MKIGMFSFKLYLSISDGSLLVMDLDRPQPVRNLETLLVTDVNDAHSILFPGDEFHTSVVFLALPIPHFHIVK